MTGFGLIEAAKMKNLTPLHYISGTGHAAQVSVPTWFLRVEWSNITPRICSDKTHDDRTRQRRVYVLTV
jgi:hypothetical protein